MWRWPGQAFARHRFQRHRFQLARGQRYGDHDPADINQIAALEQQFRRHQDALWSNSRSIYRADWRLPQTPVCQCTGIYG